MDQNNNEFPYTTDTIRLASINTDPTVIIPVNPYNNIDLKAVMHLKQSVLIAEYSLIRQKEVLKYTTPTSVFFYFASKLITVPEMQPHIPDYVAFSKLSELFSVTTGGIAWVALIAITLNTIRIKAHRQALRQIKDSIN